MSYNILKRVNFLIPLVFFFNFTFAQDKEKIENNDIENNRIKTVFMPIYQREIDEIFINTFNKAPIILSKIDLISQNLKIEIQKNSWLKKNIKELPQNIKNKKNLYKNLSKQEIENFKNVILDSELLIIPNINSEEVIKVNGKKNITLNGIIAVYSLKSGDFLFSCYGKCGSDFEEITTDINILVEKLSKILFTKIENKLKKK